MEKVNLKILYAISVAYVIAASGLYVFGYWGVFGINILPYMDVSEIIRFSLYNILASLLLLSICGIFMEFIIIPEIVIAKEVHCNKNAPIVKKIWHSGGPALLFIVIVINLVTNFSSFISQLWPYIIAMPPLIYLRRKGFLRSIIKNDSFNFLVVCSLCLYIPGSYNYGRLKAIEVRDNKNYNYIDNTNNYLPGSELKLLGKTNDYFFFSSLDNKKTIIINKDKAYVLILENFVRKDETKVAVSANNEPNILNKLVSWFTKNNKIPEQTEKPQTEK